jgi:hypothetical protein
MSHPDQTHTAAAGRLSGIRPLAHDDDERRSREDRDYGQTIFTRQAHGLPRWLLGARRHD